MSEQTNHSAELKKDLANIHNLALDVVQENFFDYQAEAQQTCSDQFHGELVSRIAFENILANAVHALRDLDLIKKAIFYGKQASAFVPTEEQLDCVEIYSDCIGDEPAEGANIIHCIIGKATEAGEMLEALQSAIFDDKPFDVTNFKEEIGDGMWYDAIGLNAVGATIEEIQLTNIAKLRARFPNKFTEYDADNRNLIAERKILENGKAL